MIYLLVYRYYEDTVIAGAYTTREKAEAAKKDIPLRFRKTYDVEEYPIDKPPVFR